jgi:uncharacterized protein YbaR (Trm112 family)
VLSSDLLAVLVCPTSKQRLIYFPRGEANQNEAEGFLLCPSSRLRYRIDNGAPVMLAEEAQALSEPVVSQLISRARELGLPIPA